MNALQQQTLDSNVITAEALIGEDDLVIRPVASAAEMRMVYRIVHDSYVQEGYVAPQSGGLLNHYPKFNFIDETTVLVAVLGGEVVGTFSLTVDGPAGLTVEDHFHDECEAIRREHRKLATGWRLAVKESMHADRRIFMGLIKELVRRCLDADVESFVITVTPPHERIYRRMLNMYPVSRNVYQETLQTPAILLRCDKELLPPQWMKLKPPSVLTAGALEFLNCARTLAAFGASLQKLSPGFQFAARTVFSVLLTFFARSL